MTSPYRSHRQMRSAQLAWDAMTDDRADQDEADAAAQAIRQHQFDAGEDRGAEMAEQNH